MGASKGNLTKLVAVAAVLLVLALGLSVLMPSLQMAKRSEVRRQLGPQALGWLGPGDLPAYAMGLQRGGEDSRPRTGLPKAIVKAFDAEIDLTPRVSVGTSTPESIYEAHFKAEILARSPAPADKQCAIVLPLPPQIISVSDLKVEINGDPSDNVALDGAHVVWTGHLDSETPTKVHVTYSAMGQGIYTLERPPGPIIDTFRARLVANRSDIRMLELSLQPTSLQREAGKTTYTWEYGRLLVSRPIALDVLGVAALDRLGELAWLGPVSVVVFGLLFALVGMAYRPEKVNAWTVLLIVGSFAGAYPLMYFLQDFVSLPAAVAASAAGVVAIIAVRAFILFGRVIGALGATLLPVAILALTLCATIYTRPASQGVFLTIEALLALVTAMVFLPKVQDRFAQGRVVAPEKPAPVVG